jgi:hypothetical protein
MTNRTLIPEGRAFNFIGAYSCSQFGLCQGHLTLNHFGMCNGLACGAFMQLTLSRTSPN